MSELAFVLFPANILLSMLLLEQQLLSEKLVNVEQTGAFISKLELCCFQDDVQKEFIKLVFVKVYYVIQQNWCKKISKKQSSNTTTKTLNSNKDNNNNNNNPFSEAH